MNRRDPVESPYYEMYPRVVLIEDDNTTIAVMEFGGESGSELRYTGSSKREPGDVFIPGVGRTLAIARAFANAAESLESAAKEYVAEIYGD